MRLLHLFSLLLIFGTGFCSNPSSPDRPVGSASAAAGQHSEGITGRITNQDGRSVEGASVLAAPLEPSGPAVPELAIVSDVQGRYHWPLRAGRYEITVVADGYQRAAKSAAVAASGSTTLDFVLSRDGRN